MQQSHAEIQCDTIARRIVYLCIHTCTVTYKLYIHIYIYTWTQWIDAQLCELWDA